MSRTRVGQRMLTSLIHELSPRDISVVRTAADFRLVSAGQLQRLHFQPSQGGSPLTAARTSRRVLQRLTELHFLTRLERRVGGVRAGSASFIYALGPLGDRLVDPSRRHRMREPSPSFVDHVLAISELYVRLMEAQRRNEFEVLEVEPEPHCWRRFAASHGGFTDLKPDLFVSVARGDLEHRWFVEVDLASEHAPTIQRKAHVYLKYLGSGREQADHGVFPRVVWQVPTTPRRERVDGALEALGAPDGLFVVAEPNDVIEVIGGSP